MSDGCTYALDDSLLVTYKRQATQGPKEELIRKQKASNVSCDDETDKTLVSFISGRILVIIPSHNTIYREVDKVRVFSSSVNNKLTH